MHQLPILFQTHIAQGLARTYPDLIHAATFIANSHLDPQNYAMPILRNTESEVRKRLADGDYEAVRESLTFEETQSIQGVIRVLVRTHLNRQGVGYVSRDAPDKTLAKRVLLPFEGDFNYQEMVDHVYFAECWRLAVEQNPNDYEKTDVTALYGLTKLRGAQRTTASVAKHMLGNDNWAKVLTGIYSGLLFLHKEYNFSSDALWSEMSNCIDNAQAAKELVKKVEHGVHQYGLALAGSFLADLGHPVFVKPDTHVIACVAALKGKDMVSQEEGVHYVYKLSEELNLPPRAVDKIFYTGCSGKLYLYGLEISNQREFKNEFLTQLRQI